MAVMGRAKSREVSYQFTSLGRVWMRKVWFRSFCVAIKFSQHRLFIYFYSFLSRKIISCIYFWLCWVFITTRAFLSLWGVETTLL